jgi:hypothetical protein
MIDCLEEDEDGNVVVTMAPGYEQVLANVGENDPALLIMWDDASVRQTVDAFNAAVAEDGAAVPPWMALPLGRLYDEDTFKRKILTYAKQEAGNGAGNVIANALIAPNDLGGFTRLYVILSFVGLDPFFIDHAVGPIGRIYCLSDDRRNTTAVHFPVQGPPPRGVWIFR